MACSDADYLYHALAPPPRCRTTDYIWTLDAHSRTVTDLWRGGAIYTATRELQSRFCS